MTDEVPTNNTEPAPGTRGRLLTFVFALVLASAWVIGSQSPSIDENQTVEQSADLGLSEKLDEQIRRALPISRITVPAIAEVGYIAGFSLRNQVWQGRDGQLFFAEDFLNPCNTNIRKSALLSISNLYGKPSAPSKANKANRERIKLIVIPDKSDAMANDLQGRVPTNVIRDLTSCQRSERPRLSATLNRYPEATRLQTISEPTNNPSQFERQPLFYKGDTHWTPGTASLLGDTALDLIAPDKPLSLTKYRESLTETKEVEIGKDLYRMAGLNKQQSMQTVMSNLRKEQAPFSKKTLIIRDSFWTAAAASTLPLFSNASVIHWKESLEYLQNHQGKFDQIVVVLVERNIFTRLLPGIFTSPQLVGALNNE